MSARDSEPNRYSPEWYETFLASIPSASTQAELDFVARQLPLALGEPVLRISQGLPGPRQLFVQTGQQRAVGHFLG